VFFPPLGYFLKAIQEIYCQYAIRGFVGEEKSGGRKKEANMDTMEAQQQTFLTMPLRKDGERSFLSSRILLHSLPFCMIKNLYNGIVSHTSVLGLLPPSPAESSS
jgi:hypothetical protein